VSISCPRGLAVVEETQRLWLSEQAAASKSAAASVPKREPAWTQVIEPNPVMLFRASAAKFNSHRIHYDRDYATKVEGLPGLAVQSTLLALFLIELCRRGLPGASLRTFTHRRVRQLYDTSGPLKLAGKPEGSQVHCWVETAEGDIAMLAEATVGIN
jgi:3-methylfumaryl-CoA hydratase